MTSERISLRQYCELSQTDISFMHSLNDAGIISFSWQEKEAFIGEEDIPALECYAHLYYDLQINIGPNQSTYQSGTLTFSGSSPMWVAIQLYARRGWTTVRATW